MVDFVTEQPDPFQKQKGFEPNLASWHSLFVINQNQLDEAARELMQRYSRYKYGFHADIHRFSFELRTLIQKEIPKELLANTEQWIVFTPPYSSVELEPSARAIGNEIAKALNLPHIDFRTEQEEARQVSYMSIKDPGMRVQAREGIQAAITDSIPVEGKSALVIDDMVTTGATAAFMNRILYEQYHLSYVAGFCLINLVTVDPTFEQYINRFIVNSGDFDTLIAILNDARTTVNRHTLKSLYGEHRYVLNAIAPRLLPAVIEKLEKARAKYLSGG